MLGTVLPEHFDAFAGRGALRLLEWLHDFGSHRSIARIQRAPVMRPALFVPAGLLTFFVGMAASGQQATPGIGVGIRSATPEEIRRSIETEDLLIQSTEPIEGLPQRLAYFIRKQLPSLSVLGHSDATEESWQYAKGQGQPSPFICFGDFDGNALEDAAVILRENASGKLHLMAFHLVNVTINPGNFSKRDYSYYEIGSAGVDMPRAPLGDLKVSCNPPGTFQSVDGSITLGLKNSSILLGYSLNYFDGGAYRSLLVGD